MKIITRYVLKEHVGPFVFALSALTSLLLLQYIARRFGDLVGRGLSWQTITEFFLLSIPFTLAMTMPMSVLVAVLYAFSRMASENEITALKAGGVSTRSLMKPAVVAASFLTLFMLYFNDQLLPRSNHELATLQMAILRTKPTFALKPQVINTVKEGQLYLRAGQIDEGSGHMHDVTIYDLTDATKRKTIYADSGILSFAQNRKDLSMHLFKGLMLTSPNDRPGQLNRVYYHEDVLKVRDVANEFKSIDADTSSKGDREMSVCEMQKGYEGAHASVRRAQYDSVLAMWRVESERGGKAPQPKPDSLRMKAGGIGALYCAMIDKARNYVRVKEAQAAEPNFFRQQQQQPQQQQPQQQQPQQQQPQQQQPARQAQDTSKAAARDSIFVIVNQKYVKVPKNQIPDNAYDLQGHPLGKAAGTATGVQGVQPSPPPPVVASPAAGKPPATATPNTATPSPATPNPAPNPAAANTAATGAPAVVTNPEILDAKARLDEARHRRNRYGVEIQKKFSLAAACVVFVLVGAPIALRFPRGGVGLVIGVSFAVFAIYYVGLIGGESLANKNIISPFWAMWADNIIFLIVGIILIARMGHEGVTSRGGNFGEAMDATRQWFARQGRRIGIGAQAERATT